MSSERRIVKMKKRITIEYIVATIILIVILAGLIVINTINKNDYKYHVNEDGKTITLDKYLGEDEEVIIPDNIDGKDVTVIGAWCFKMNETIVDVFIPSTVEEIESSAFAICHKLERVRGGENICYVGDAAFTMSKKLSEVPSLEKLSDIYDSTFRGCESLNNVKVSNTLMHIGRGAFGNTGINYDIVPDSVKMIGGSAFFETSKIKENNDYIIVGDNVLIEFPDIEIVNVPEGVKVVTYNSVKNNVNEMYLPNSIICVDSNILYKADETDQAIIYIPESVVQIGTFYVNFFEEEKMHNVECICGIKGSYAQEYAERVGIRFREVEPWY